MNAASLALRHSRGILFLAVSMSVAGLIATFSLPKGVYPELTFPREEVVANLAGAPATTVIAGITRPLEEALASVPGVQTVRSRTIRGAVAISLFFAPSTDMAQAHSLVLARVAEVRTSLPPNTELRAARVLPSGFPILSINVEAPYPPEQLYALAQYTIRPALSGLPGIGLVSVQSSDIPEVQVLFDPGRLQAAHLTLVQIADRLRKANVVQTVARMTEAHELSLGIVTGELHTIADVANVVVGGTPAVPLRIGDLGRVVESIEPRTSLIRVDGKPGVIINVSRRLGGDILQLTDEVWKTLERIRPSLPPDVKFIPVYEQATFVQEAVTGVRDAVLFGALFAVLVLAFFLRDARATLIAALSLPLTLASALLVLRALGETVNLMTLGGLAMSVGLVIDDAVVVIEAVHKHLEAGLSPAEAARRGTDELFWPVVGTTATTVVVFLPLGLLSGVAGQFFISLSLALASAVIISLPVALAVLPGLAARVLRPVKRKSAGSGLARKYDQILEWAIAHRAWVVGISAVTILLGFFAGRTIPTDFLPEADEGAYVIDYFAPVGASLADSDELASRVEAVLRSTPEVASFSRRLGAELGPPTATLSSRGDVAVRLHSKRSRTIAEIMDEQRAQIAAVAPGLRIEFIQVLSDMLGDLQGSPEPVEVKIFGPDPDQLQQLAAAAAGRLRDTPGLVDFFNGDEGCAPELNLKVDPLRAGRQNLSTTDIADQMAAAHLGEVATQLRLPDHLEGVRVRLDKPPGVETSPSDLENTPVLGATGERVPVLALTHPEPRCAVATQLRENQRFMIHITSRLSNLSLGQAISAVRARLADWKLPVGYNWELGGLYNQQKDSFQSLLIALAAALAAVTAVLLFQLRSISRSLAVLAATPLALAAGIATLAITRVSLNVSSLMGAIVLVGLVVKNGILLLDYIMIAEERGQPLAAAVREAAAARVRPILMTTLATLVALLPLVFGFGAGSSLHKPLAMVVVGGLAFSTAATLLLVPVLVLSFARGSPSTPAE